MKKTSFFVKTARRITFGLMCMSLCTLTLAACSSDDDDNNGPAQPPVANFDEPAHAAEAAKFVIKESSSNIRSVEFTESGNYIITTEAASAPSAAPAKSAKSKVVSALSRNLMARKQMTREYDVYSPILYGKYTKTNDNTYVLEGWGTVTVNTDAQSGAYALELQPTGGQSQTLTATKENANKNSTNSTRLCRTWEIAKQNFYMKYNGRYMMNLTANTFVELAEKLKNWAQQNDDEYDPEEWEYILQVYKDVEPKQVVFTKTGTYMVYYKNEKLAVSTWRWTNDAETRLQYSWTNDFNDTENPYMGGFVDISFQGNQLLMTEKKSESEDGETFEQGMTFFMNEVK